MCAKPYWKKNVFSISILKSIRFNWVYFPLKSAVKLPVLVSRNVRLKKLSGRVQINSPVSCGMVKLGFGDVGIFDKRLSKAVWNNVGLVAFSGTAYLGHGFKVSVYPGAELEFGSSFVMTAQSSIICKHGVSFGRGCLISWDCIIMDTDFHPIYIDRHRINEDKPVLVGDKVWIGMRCSILKGAVIPNGCMVAAGTTLAQALSKEKCVYGGLPVRVLKENISWEMYG